eukprot:scaffold94687_cov29-Tisochrysis_lutea.AAC.4
MASIRAASAHTMWPTEPKRPAHSYAATLSFGGIPPAMLEAILTSAPYLITYDNVDSSARCKLEIHI